MGRYGLFIEIILTTIYKIRMQMHIYAYENTILFEIIQTVYVIF